MTFHRHTNKMLTAHDSELLTFAFELKGLYTVPDPPPVADRVQLARPRTVLEYIKQEAIKVDTEAIGKRKEALGVIEKIRKLGNDPGKIRNTRNDQASASFQTLDDLLVISTGVTTRTEINIIRQNFNKLTNYALNTDSRTTKRDMQHTP